MNLPERETPHSITTTSEATAKLPVHLPSLLIGIKSRRRLLAACTLGSLIVGFGCAELIGKKSYEARTVLLYRPPPTGSTLPAGEVDENDTPTLLTQMDMVKIDRNLQEVRRRLNLSDSVDALGSNIKVDVPANSSLMTIIVNARQAQRASDIANAIRQVFLEEELEVQHTQARSKAKDLAARQDKVMHELKTAEQNLKDFTIRNHVVDLDKEAGWYLQQLINTELVYEEAVGQDNASRLQEENIGRIAAGLEKKVQAEEAQLNTSGPLETDPQTNTAQNPTAEAIRGRIADLKMKEIDMDRAKTLTDQGIYSKRDYEKAKAAYEQERFLLYKDSPSAALYKDMNLRELDVQLAHISDQQKVAHLSQAVQHVHERLDSLPLVQRDYLALSREVAIRAAEREHIDQLLSLARRESESETFAFSVVSEAAPPLLPLKSNRRLVFVAVCVTGSALGLALVVILELSDRRLRSIGDARTKLNTEVLAGFKHGLIEQGQISDEALMLTGELRHLGIGQGSTLMVVSPTYGEGAPELASMLARTLASGGDSISLVDACFRAHQDPDTSTRVLPRWLLRSKALLRNLRPEIFLPPVKQSESSLTEAAQAQQAKGLSDLLKQGRGDQLASLPLGERIHLLPSGRAAMPELLLGHKLGTVISETIPAASIRLIHAPPVHYFPDATFLTPIANLAILVAAAGKTTAEVIEACTKKLQDSGIRVLGVVITNIADAFTEQRLA